MKAHVSTSIHVYDTPTAAIDEYGILVVSFGPKATMFVYRERSPGFFDALVEILDVKLPESVEAG